MEERGTFSEYNYQRNLSARRIFSLYTVNKLKSINSLFSSMFCVEYKIIHVGVVKSPCYINKRFTIDLNI
jgi:hypothetical protein